MIVPARLSALWPVLLALVLAACASRRPQAGASGEGSPADTCTARVELDGAVPGRAPTKTVEGRDAYGNLCLTAYGLEAVAKNLACREGFPAVGVVNIQRPGYFRGRCHRADFDLYSTAEGFARTEDPIVRLEPIEPTGVQVLGGFHFGPVLSGEQDETGLVSENGDEASTSKGGVHLVVRWYPLAWAGLEAETGGLWGSASAEDTKSMSFSRAWSTNAGLSFIPWQRLSLAGRYQAAVSGGLNYTRLAFADEFRDFVEEKGGILLFEDAASGFGWYAAGAFRHINRIGLVSEFVVRYLEENPKFSEGGTLEGNQLLFGFNLGYRF